MLQGSILITHTKIFHKKFKCPNIGKQENVVYPPDRIWGNASKDFQWHGENPHDVKLRKQNIKLYSVETVMKIQTHIHILWVAGLWMIVFHLDFPGFSNFLQHTHITFMRKNNKI